MAMCLGCNAIMVMSTIGDYCHDCRNEIAAEARIAEKNRLKGAKSRTVIDTQHWRPTNRDRMPYFSFGKRKPKLYRRPE